MLAKREFARRLMQMLWNDYAERVPYARTYQNMLMEMHGALIHDHVTFRSIGITAQYGTYLGISNIKRVFDALDFQDKGCIEFPVQKLFARFLQHDDPNLPKIYISELKVEDLPEDTVNLIRNAVLHSKQLLSDAEVDRIATLRDHEDVPEDLLQQVYEFLLRVPWGTPSEATLMKVDKISEYGAWVLLHGYNVNHFSGYVNRHGIDGIDDIEGLAAELKRRGVVMDDVIEGEPDGKLRRTGTKSTTAPVKVIDEFGKEKEIEWTYSRLEFAQRNEVVVENGRRELYEGFPGPETAKVS